ncbi:MAG: FAD-dependent oxidoreductase [Actinomycetota bacterium]|nr:FAD-dependent oxidoreductase [Actinomycetota bacterium]
MIGPDDAGYDGARTIFPGGIDRWPAVIVRPADATDVAHVVSLARETGQELAVRSGGHSIYSVSEGGIVLDLSDMKELQIDVEGRTAWAETGLTAVEYTTATGAHGLATGFGDTGSVGIGGLTLGGGVGYLVRKHGLTIEDLLAAEIVTADGELRWVDAETHPTSSGRSVAAAGTLGWRPASSSGCTRSTSSTRSSPRRRPLRRSSRPSPTLCRHRRCHLCRRSITDN